MTLQALIHRANYEIAKANITVQHNLDQIDQCKAEIQRQDEIIKYWQDSINSISDNM